MGLIPELVAYVLEAATRLLYVASALSFNDLNPSYSCVVGDDITRKGGYSADDCPYGY
jgi:hypothetical protein